MLADRPQGITFGEMRDMGVRGVLVYCADHKCSHSVAVSADQRGGGCRTSSRGSSVRAAASVARRFARTSTGIDRPSRRRWDTGIRLERKQPQRAGDVLGPGSFQAPVRQGGGRDRSTGPTAYLAPRS
jgi:hypothetical protein